MELIRVFVPGHPREFTSGLPVILKFLEFEFFFSLAVLSKIMLKFSTYFKFPEIHIM